MLICAEIFSFELLLFHKTQFLWKELILLEMAFLRLTEWVLPGWVCVMESVECPLVCVVESVECRCTTKNKTPNYKSTISCLKIYIWIMLLLSVKWKISRYAKIAWKQKLRTRLEKNMDAKTDTTGAIKDGLTCTSFIGKGVRGNVNISKGDEDTKEWKSLKTYRTKDGNERKSF